MAIEPDRLALFEEMREDELDAAALYRALADASEGRRRDVLSRLAEAEERHAGHWERLLREAGVTEFSSPRPTLRTRVLSTLAHRFGADTVLPLVLRLEANDAAKYRDVAEAPEAMSAAEGRASRSPGRRAATGPAPAGRSGPPCSGSTTVWCRTSCSSSAWPAAPRTATSSCWPAWRGCWPGPSPWPPASGSRSSRSGSSTSGRSPSSGRS